MGDFLSLDNILTGDEAASLFSDEVEEVKEKSSDSVENEEEKTTEIKEHRDELNATEVNSDELFDEEPESVGSGEVNKQEDTNSKEDGSSPDNTNFYSSIASALKEEGIFPDLEDDIIEQITEPEDFKNLIDQQIHAGLHEAQKRIYDALNAGVEPNVIQKYESTLSYLNSITEDHINEESEQGEQLRRQLLMQDFMNRGYSQERAAKMTNKLFDSGEDIEEAKQALVATKEYFGGKYQAILTDAKKQAEYERMLQQKQATELKKMILEDENIYGDASLDKNIRRKAFENLTKPLYKDPKSGQYLTAIQKYRSENENEYTKNVALLYTLTDGFKNIDKLAKPSVKKEVKKKLRELEHTLKRTDRGNSGNMKYVGSPLPNKDTLFSNDFTIDMS